MKDKIYNLVSGVLLDGVKLGTAQVVGQGINNLMKKALTPKDKNTEETEPETKETKADKFRKMLNGELE